VSAAVSTAGALDDLNTLGVRSSADRVVVADSIDALRRVIFEARDEAVPLLVIGGGSNVVLQRHWPGIACLVRMRGVRVDAAGVNRFAVTAAAGEGWHALVRYCLGRGLFGLENLALIPGSVGAAPLQNIGAYGVELADRLLSVQAMDVNSGEIRDFDRASCRFGYRDSVFKSVEPGRYVITQVTMELSTQPGPVLDYPDLRAELKAMGRDDPSPVQVAEAVIRVRRRKLPDPRHVGNVGSFFKNPVVDAGAVAPLRKEIADLVVHDIAGKFKLSAAQLIDRAGWKGARRGKVGVWPRQPLVLVNLGGGSGTDFITLGEEIRADIHSRYGVTLELEPRILGEP